MKFPELDELQTMAGKGLTAVGDAATSTAGQTILGGLAQGLMDVGRRNQGPINQLGGMLRTGLLANYGAQSNALKKKQNLALLANQKATLDNQQKTQQLAQDRFAFDKENKTGARDWAKNFSDKSRQHGSQVGTMPRRFPERFIPKSEIEDMQYSPFNPNQAEFVKRKTTPQKLNYSPSMLSAYAEHGLTTDEQVRNASDEMRKKAIMTNRGNQGRKNPVNIMHEGLKIKQEQFAKWEQQVNTIASKSADKLSLLDMQESILSGVSGFGTIGEMRQELMVIAKGLGIPADYSELGMGEVSKAIGNLLAVGMKPPASGPMTDADFIQYLETVPQRLQTPEGRALVFATMRAQENRNVTIQRLMSENLAAKREAGAPEIIDQSFIQEIARFKRENPMFTKTGKYGIEPIDYEKINDEKTAKAAETGNYTPSGAAEALKRRNR